MSESSSYPNRPPYGRIICIYTVDRTEFFDLSHSTDIIEKKYKNKNKNKNKNKKHITHKYVWICMYFFHFKK